MKTFTVYCVATAHSSAEITVEAEDLVGACRAAIDESHTADAWESLDAGYPTFVAAIAEGRAGDPRRSVADWRDTSVLPVPRLFSDVAACAGYAATRSEDLVAQLRIMIDAIDADGGLRITPGAMVRLCATGKAILDDIATCGVRPTISPAPDVATLPPPET